jgi:hypothetical protein
MEWFKKNIILAILQLLTLAILGIVGYSFTGIMEEIDKKADKETIDIIIEPIREDILELKQNDKDMQELFLEEVRLLRQDLRLKKDKTD